MFAAQIAIVDDAHHIDDRVRIVGMGQVAIVTRDEARLQEASDEPADVDAIITLRDGVVTLEAKKPQALCVADEYLQMGTPRAVQQELVAAIAGVNRHLHVRRLIVPDGSLMVSGGAVMRDEPSELERWCHASVARGVIKVRAELASLRARGMIDEQGRLLVPFPTDMNLESKTDV